MKDWKIGTFLEIIIHSINKNILETWYMPDTIPSAENSSGDKVRGPDK